MTPRPCGPLRRILEALGAGIGVVVMLPLLCVPQFPLVGPIARWALPVVCRRLVRALGLHVEQQGRMPAGGVLLLANHLSWLDIPILVSTCRCGFIAKREVAEWPLVGAWAKAFGVVFVDRTRRRDLLSSIPALEQALRAGRPMLVFAEGTTTVGDGVLPFKSSLVEAAVRADVPVVPVTLLLASPSDDRQALAWVGNDTLLPNLRRVTRLREIQGRVVIDPAVPSHPDRKQRTAAAHARVAERVGQSAIRSRLVKQNFRPMESSEREMERYRAIFSG